jgi:hypothetical protein
MIWLLTIGAASASLRDVTICADYTVQYTDAVNTPTVPDDGVGDFWADNSTTRAGIGPEYVIRTDVASYTGNLGTNGCATRRIEVDTDTTYDLQIFSQTRRRGVDIIFRYNDTPDSVTGNYYWEDGARLEEEFFNLPTSSIPGAVITSNVVIPAIEGWQFLAVGTWLIHRNKWKLGQNLTLDCCIGTSNLDGTSDANCLANGTGYERDRAPYLASQPELRILGKEDLGTTNNVTNNPCCGSRIDSRTDPDGYISGMSGGVDEQRRYTIAHELGHVLVGLRMGGRENGQYPHNAPLNDCMGSLFANFNPQDTDCAPTRGQLTKEYMSTAAREGWADFVTAWAWNVKGHADCETTIFLYQDFDLDGDEDNWFGNNDWRNGIYSCIGEPEWAQADASDPTDTFSRDPNWLDGAQKKGVCERFEDDTDKVCLDDPPVCDEPELMESINRSTVYDWQRMLYALYKDENLAPGQLSDLYINMCPRDWRPNDGTCDDNPSSPGADLPLIRWEASASALGLSTAVSNQIDGVEH